jgi:hypothetical protein
MAQRGKHGSFRCPGGTDPALGNPPPAILGFEVMILRRNRGLAASPPVRYRLKMPESLLRQHFQRGDWILRIQSGTADHYGRPTPATEGLYVRPRDDLGEASPPGTHPALQPRADRPVEPSLIGSGVTQRLDSGTRCQSTSGTGFRRRESCTAPRSGSTAIRIPAASSTGIKCRCSSRAIRYRMGTVGHRLTICGTCPTLMPSA